MTIRREETIFINRSPEEVFELAVNPEHTPKWQRFLLWAEKLTDGPLRVGSRLSHFRTYYGGLQFESTPEITGFEPNRAYRAQDKAEGGPFWVDGGFTVDPQNGGTKLTYTFLLVPQGKFKLKPLEWLIGTLWLREARNDFRNLKKMVEVRQAPTRT